MRKSALLLIFCLSLLAFGIDHELTVLSFENEKLTFAVKPLYTQLGPQRAYIFTQTGHRLVKESSQGTFIFDVSRTDWVIPEVTGKNILHSPMTGTNPTVLRITTFREQPELFLFSDTQHNKRLYVILKIPKDWKFIKCTLQNSNFHSFTYSGYLYLYTDNPLKDGIHQITLDFELPYGMKKQLKRDLFILGGIANFLRGSTAPYIVEQVPPYQHLVKSGETLWSIANTYGLRIADLELANGLEDGSRIIAGTTLKLARVRFDSALTTVVINTMVARMAVYYNGFLVKTFPAAIGKSDTTPPGIYWITKKEIDPALYWYGEYIPPRSPINGLGTRFLQLSNPTYGIHGTTKPWEIGKRISHGCVRMLNQDVETLDAFVDVGTKIIVIRNTEPFPERLEDLL
ncbi:L,D-transpeptidase family protein [Pseudothermotoga sp. U03pept]|uniref:L,D-transpeptidase family protein n=1 Tax=Pseudothermotoga sp. U03pept TaxID=3447012 RepID=UPI003F110D8F